MCSVVSFVAQSFLKGQLIEHVCSSQDEYDNICDELFGQADSIVDCSTEDFLITEFSGHIFYPTEIEWMVIISLKRD